MGFELRDWEAVGFLPGRSRRPAPSGAGAAGEGDGRGRGWPGQGRSPGAAAPEAAGVAPGECLPRSKNVGQHFWVRVECQPGAS